MSRRGATASETPRWGSPSCCQSEARWWAGRPGSGLGPGPPLAQRRLPLFLQCRPPLQHLRRRVGCGPKMHLHLEESRRPTFVRDAEDTFMWTPHCSPASHAQHTHKFSFRWLSSAWNICSECNHLKICLRSIELTFLLCVSPLQQNNKSDLNAWRTGL